MRLLNIALLIACMPFLLSCGQQDGSGSGDKFSYCNKKAGGNLTEYANCRCRQITGDKSWTQAMDDCNASPKVYAEGFEGEIPQRIRDAMNR